MVNIPLEPRVAGSPIPLTCAQLDLWRSCITGGRYSNMKVSLASVRIQGELNTAILKSSLDAVVQRHESLRTRIIVTGASLRQEVDPDHECDFEEVDLSTTAEQGCLLEAGRIAEEFATEMVDLSVGPLFSARLIKLSALDHILLLLIDHIVSDGVSGAVLSGDLWTMYRDAVAGAPESLTKLRVQFADYAVWQQRILDSFGGATRAVESVHMTHAPRMELPYGVGRASTMPRVSRLDLPLGSALSLKLASAAKQQRTLLSLMVLASAVAAVSRWCIQRDVVLAVASHGRQVSPELKGMIGLLAHSVFCHVEIEASDRLADVLDKVSLEFFSACQRIHRAPQREWESGFRPQVGFNWLTSNWMRSPGPDPSSCDAQLSICPFRVPTSERLAEESALDLWIEGSLVGATEVILAFRYRSDRISGSAIAILGKYLQLITEEIAERPCSRITSITLG